MPCSRKNDGSVAMFLCRYGASHVFDPSESLDLKFKHDFSTLHHRTVGTIERNHRMSNAYLKSYLIDNNDDWDVYAKYFQFCYNTTPINLSIHPLNWSLDT